MHCHAHGELRELPLFRPYDKATIWEHRDLAHLASRLEPAALLWECMGLTPSYVDVLQRLMGLQNIKGTGMDFVYRWQAWEACHEACNMLVSRDIAMQSIGGLLAATSRRRTPFDWLRGLLEDFLDVNDAIRRRTKADRIYRDLQTERISRRRAAQELRALDKRQKGGWLRGGRSQRRRPSAEPTAANKPVPLPPAAMDVALTASLRNNRGAGCQPAKYGVHQDVKLENVEPWQAGSLPHSCPATSSGLRLNDAAMPQPEVGRNGIPSHPMRAKPQPIDDE